MMLLSQTFASGILIRIMLMIRLYFQDQDLLTLVIMHVSNVQLASFGEGNSCDAYFVNFPESSAQLPGGTNNTAVTMLSKTM